MVSYTVNDYGGYKNAPLTSPALGSTTDGCPLLWPLWTHHPLAPWPCFPGATPARDHAQWGCSAMPIPAGWGPPLRHLAPGTLHWQGWTFLRAALRLRHPAPLPSSSCTQGQTYILVCRLFLPTPAPSPRNLLQTESHVSACFSADLNSCRGPS